jgi:hypothetical protein
MANVNPQPYYPPTLRAPLNYPKSPSSGKISILFDSNEKDIYRKFSPYTERGSLIGTGQKQPYIWRYPDEKNKGFGRKLPKFLRVLEDVGIAPTVSGADDIERIGEWLVSGYGIQYSIKQTILQAYQPFNETAIYNPLSPLIATIQPVSLGLIDRPTRFIDQGSVLGAILSALGLKGSFGGLTDKLIGKAIGGSPYTTIPPGSAGYAGFLAPITGVANLAGLRLKGIEPPINPLPDDARDGGKGLLRGRTAIKAKTTFRNQWGPVSSVESIGNMIRDAIDPLIPNFIPRSAGAIFRADEDAYLYMIADPRNRLRYYTKSKSEVPISQMWYADTKNFQPSSKFVPIRSREFRLDVSRFYVTGYSIDGRSTGYGLTGGGLGLLGDILSGKGFGGMVARGVGSILSAVAMPYVNGIASLVGISLTGQVKVKDRSYGDVIGRPSDPYSLENSEILVRYSEWLETGAPGTWIYKQDTGTAEFTRLDGLKRVLTSINNTDLYTTDVPRDSSILSSPNPTVRGYNAIAGKTSLFQNRVNGTSKEYSDTQAVRVIDAGVSRGYVPSVRLATTNKPDLINQLGILGKDRKVNGISGPYSGKSIWNPYEDDLIAFFFYDVVNQKYIPFRATVKGINETGTALWEEMKFIGRADMVYSYTGFTRNLAFSFNVVISSLSELLPTWKRISYMASSIKPSNYVQIGGAHYNKFMVPPMFMINIGDLYKYQPCVITSIGVSIPEDAVWETLNEENSREWSYLNGMIKSPAIGKKYAQFPKEAEINITCNLLEKERPIVGGANFGHSPHTPEYINGEYVPSDPGAPYLPTPSEFDKGLVEYQNFKYSPAAKGRTTQGAVGENTSPPQPSVSTPTTQATTAATGQKNTQIAARSVRGSRGTRG